MSLLDKVSQLKTTADAASKTALFWEHAIAAHGEQKATEFYTFLGLNHLETKSVEYDGLILSREPRDSEKLCVKGVAQAQEAGKASISAILLEARDVLIDDAIEAVKKLTPADYHTLVLTVPDKLRDELRDELTQVFMKGKRLVDAELAAQTGKADSDLEVKQADPTEEDDQELDDYTDLTDARVANDVQSRITGAIARFALLGLVGAALYEAVRKELADGSVSYIDRAAGEAANSVISLGRYREMQDRAAEIGRYEYSSLLDNNTCGPCNADDGKEASSPDDLPDTPNPDCEGGAMCRCFIIAVAEGNM